MSKTFKLYERQDKGKLYRQALLEHGYTEAEHCDFMLADNDRRLTDKPLFVIPHSARSLIMWDGILDQRNCTCNFVISAGQQEVMRRYGYKYPLEVAGWTFSDILPFRPSKEIKRVLFAPIHPNTSKDNNLAAVDIEVNQKCYDILKDLPIELTIRHYGSLERNGLPHNPKCQYDHATLTLEDSTAAMARGYDVIVGHQTFAYVAVALGYPTVMVGESLPPHSLDVPVQHWDAYKDLLMYPLDLLNGGMAVLEEAAQNEQTAWKRCIIGEKFDGDNFVNTLERYL